MGRGGGVVRIYNNNNIHSHAMSVIHYSLHYLPTLSVSILTHRIAMTQIDLDHCRRSIFAIFPPSQLGYDNFPIFPELPLVSVSFPDQSGCSLVLNNLSVHACITLLTVY